MDSQAQRDQWRKNSEEAAEDIALYYRTLVKEGVPEQVAGELAKEFSRGTFNLFIATNTNPLGGLFGKRKEE